MLVSGCAILSAAIFTGAAIYVSGLAESIEQGVRKAREAIAGGAARDKLEQLIEFSNRFKTT